jgi:hypothetical protein
MHEGFLPDMYVDASQYMLYIYACTCKKMKKNVQKMKHM